MPMDENLLNDILRRLLEARNSWWPRQVPLTDEEIQKLCLASGEIFMKQPNLLELEAPIKVCGDVHGQYSDLLLLLQYGGLPPMARYLFLGNYIDYGKQSLETICLLLAFKVKYPEDFFLLRGNHECASINFIYGFYDECKRRFNVKLWETFIDCFNCLPVAAVIDEKIFCVHGGLSPDLKDLGQIKNIPRPVDVPDHGLLCDLVWADPDSDIEGWGENDRGVSYTFGADKVLEFLEKHELDLICRGHQVVEYGYEFFAKRRMVTLFSAPNFLGEYDNYGAMMSIDGSLMCSFQILKPSDKKLIKWTLSSGSSSQPLQNVLGAAAAAVAEKVLAPAGALSVKNRSRPVTPLREKMKSMTAPPSNYKSPRREKMKSVPPPPSKYTSPRREKMKSVPPPPSNYKSPPHENKKSMQAQPSKNKSPPHENKKSIKAQPSKNKSPPRMTAKPSKNKSPSREKMKSVTMTPPSKNISPTPEEIKSVTTPPKNKSRPVTRPRKNMSRPQTPPLRKEQKQ